MDNLDNPWFLLALVAIIAFALYQMWKVNEMENFDVHLEGEKVEYVDLKHVMSFLEYVQTNDLDPNSTPYVAVDWEDHDAIIIGNHLRQLLALFHYLSTNEWFDTYASRCPSVSLTVHDYYRGADITINGVALKFLLEESPGELLSLYVPGNQPRVRRELVEPLKMLRQSLVAVVNTGKYRDYATYQKFAPKYAGMQLNPQLLKL